MFLVAGKWVCADDPSIFFNVGHDMPTRCHPSLIAKQPNDFRDSFLMMPFLSVPKAIFRRAGIFIKPAVDFLIRILQQDQ
jgi:hypothetical protein